MLLLITGSQDGTSSLLVLELGNENVFRFNYDLFQDYTLEFTPDYWKITNPVGHSIDSNQVTSVFWWKAFNFYLMNQEEFIVEEVKYIFRELYHWCRLRGLTKGLPHDFHNHMGKMNILSVASQYFKIPKTLATLKLGGLSSLGDMPVVAKSFTSGLTTTNKALMTTAVNKEALHPDFPWYLQELITSKADLTTFICGDKQYTFSRDRSNLKGLDWRTEQNFDIDAEEWVRVPMSQELQNSVTAFCKELGVDWGRLDLMEHEGEIIFLEYNANGQWVFLDMLGKHGLVKDVAKYLTTPNPLLVSP
ncbi:hypothetical protein G6659_05460 [Polynucleobacter paneuropaeus]|nr:hypothetical protein G6659_05460 [Polynucleobacter paneuropaeus]